MHSPRMPTIPNMFGIADVCHGSICSRKQVQAAENSTSMHVNSTLPKGPMIALTSTPTATSAVADNIIGILPKNSPKADAHPTVQAMSNVHVVFAIFAQHELGRSFCQSAGPLRPQHFTCNPTGTFQLTIIPKH